jgi:hypothetical protein
MRRARTVIFACCTSAGFRLDDVQDGVGVMEPVEQFAGESDDVLWVKAVLAPPR